MEVSRVSWKSNPTIRRAPHREEEKVYDIYNACPVPGFVIEKIEVGHSDYLAAAFQTHLRVLQERASMPQFKVPTLSSRKEGILRQFHELCTRYKDDDCPNVRILPVWHGTESDPKNILRTGFVNLQSTDSGFFESGLYFSVEPEYSWKVYAKGRPLLLTWVCTFNTFPILFEDQRELKGKYATVKDPYDSYFAPVIRKGGTALTGEEKAQYHEIVVFQSAACLPAFRVKLKQALPHEVPPPTNPTKSFNGGVGVGIDLFRYGGEYQKAFQYFKALEDDTSHGIEACWYLGYLVDHFIFPKRVSSTAFFDKASSLPHKANNKDPWTLFQLGLWLERKSSPDVKKAKELYSESGIPEARYRLGKLSLSDLAFEHIVWSASKGYPPALYEMGKIFESKAPSIDNLRRSFQYYKAAALKNHPLAQYKLACCYETARGTDKKNSSKSKQYMEKAAKQFVVEFQRSDYADLNDEPTLCALGDFFLNGLGGFPKEPTKAVELLKQAAKKNGSRAIYLLGTCFETGHGANSSISTAFKHYYLCSLQNSTSQQTANQRMQSLLDSDPDLLTLTENLHAYSDIIQNI